MLYLTSLVSVALLIPNSVVGYPGEAPPTSLEASFLVALSLKLPLTVPLRIVIATLLDADTWTGQLLVVSRLLRTLERSAGLPLVSPPYKRALTVDEVASTSHLSNVTGLTSNSDPFMSNSLCVLTPELEQGSHYVQDQAGVSAYVGIELIDVSTCEPLTGVYLDNTTFLRGIKHINDEGYAQFQTIFPGHYSGRTTHFRMIVHEDGTVFDNGTFKSDGNQHIGQVFFDQDFITAVEATTPYHEQYFHHTK
ncbi:Intradiol ring-cleavage dioxygenase [Armillaria borealis]|uniref:Intradiol ring-cleavage dioxygenase n=1 Tax=Armillaria borealis TaxID=47425 RepID=A0AA39IEV9_9AGAR|nr:Intradiol ring-cleavage dioxygenase [Armillaria borealis]